MSKDWTDNCEHAEEFPRTYVPIAEAYRARELILPQGMRCLLGSLMPPEAAIAAFFGRCGFEGFHLISEGGILSATATSGDNGADLVSAPHRVSTPATLQGYVFFQVYSDGIVRREVDDYFAHGIGFFSAVSSRLEDLFISGTGPLWVEGAPTRNTDVTIRI